MQLLESLAMQLTGTMGNGFYNLGGLLLNVLLLGNKRLPRKLILIGLPGWFFGFGLSIACATYALEAAKIFTALGMVWSTAWIFGVSALIFPKKAELKIDA
jgi:hypothetical protein